jgi:hypothetical protein
MTGKGVSFNSSSRTVLFSLLFVLCLLFFNGLIGSRLRSTTQQFSSTKQGKTPILHNSSIYKKNDDVGKITERILYSIHREEFVDKFVSCSIKPTCHILYWHIQKTGGTYIASRLYGGMNLVGYNSKEWCCHGSFMTKRFRPNPEGYCSNKLGVYEVKPHHFKEVIKTCQSLPAMKNRTFVGMISVREPLEQTISAIHQRCNVHSAGLEEPVRSVCERCSYSGNDTVFFDRITNHTNAIFQGMESVIENPAGDIPLLILDNGDISDFFQSVESHATDALKRFGLLTANETFQFPTGRSNAQDKVAGRLCDFGMPATMMKHHATSLRIYRWITQGRYGSSR